ncbi:endonuclease/exonuclease/phosphatase family protein [Actinobacteria bacterium YIM 96077]|uniref:Endonuclease/exonuclease/phosphatase domain-containing protein n=1 Tax=Phytoactinopolyspora halophila TaxID=1981511 RepID=A0A329QTM5_9ACTN|nr:endonuclease/exonuclease/phosphatase family protein [Actinobacteria bacterium YIM 96077]RAW15391.1 hypothetical protein DPM12_09060 [Phytoactinopolyspora halophila]
MLSYNINWAQGGDVAERTLDYIRENEPDVVTFTEICKPTFERYVDELTELGYAGNFLEVNTTLNCGLDGFGFGKQGSAVFVAGGAQPGSEESYPDVGQGVPCITSDSNPPVRACSVHLPSGPRDAQRELAQLREDIIPASHDQPLVLGGDFNLEVTDWETEQVKPYNQAMQDFYDDFYEVDMHDPMCRDTQPAEYEGQFGGACTAEHPEQGKKKIDYAFVDNVHFTSDVSGEILDLGPCTDIIIGPEHRTRDVPCSDHEALTGTASFDPEAFPEPELTLRRYGISTASELTGSGLISFGLSSGSLSRIQDRLSAALGPTSYSVNADGAAPECADQVDDYVVWGSRSQPELAIAVADRGDGPALVGYRLYENIPTVQLPDEARIGAARTALPTTYMFLDLGLELIESQDGVSYRLTGPHLSPDVGALDGKAEDAPILERGAGEQCRLDTLVSDPLVEPIPEGTWRWTLRDQIDTNCFNDVILECTQLAWEGEMELHDDGTITGEGELDWKDGLGCARKAIGRIDTITVTAKQPVTLRGQVNGNRAEVELSFGEPHVEHDPVPNCLHEKGELYTPDILLESIDEFEQFLTIDEPIRITQGDQQWFGPLPDFRTSVDVAGRPFQFTETFECANAQCD